MPNAAYIAPMGWQVLAGLMVNAFLSISNAVVCLSNISIMFEFGCLKSLKVPRTVFRVSHFQIILKIIFKDGILFFTFLNYELCILNYALFN